MNQILNTKMKKPKNKKKVFFTIQFYISIGIFLLLIIGFIYSAFSLKNQEKIAKNLVGNYNLYQLYSHLSTEEDASKETSDQQIFAFIEIPKIEIYYPVFSSLNEELLKTSPCKFYGGSLDQYDNICIAGHNYNNTMFFSRIYQLEVNDEIYLFDPSGKKYTYIVFQNYEVKENDLSPIFNYSHSSKELTLITCNNFNKNRIIIKARQQ